MQNFIKFFKAMFNAFRLWKASLKTKLEDIVPGKKNKNGK